MYYAMYMQSLDNMVSIITVKVINISARWKNNMKVEINLGHIKEFQIHPFEQKLCN